MFRAVHGSFSRIPEEDQPEDSGCYRLIHGKTHPFTWINFPGRRAGHHHGVRRRRCYAIRRSHPGALHASIGTDAPVHHPDLLGIDVRLWAPSTSLEVRGHERSQSRDLISATVSFVLIFGLDVALRHDHFCPLSVVMIGAFLHAVEWLRCGWARGCSDPARPKRAIPDAY